MRRALLVALAACGHPPASRPPGNDPSILAALPKPAPIATDRFTSVVVCDRCHTAGATQMRDAKGADISPVTEIQAGMMSLAARDPYYLAAVRRELAANPGAKSAIETTCLRCHAPVGFAETPALTLDDL